MIGYLQGIVLFSDGLETIIGTNSGVGHQVFYNKVLAEGSQASLYISHIIKETSQELYGFNSLREKKLFEMMIGVKGVGPKSAYILTGSLGVNSTIEAISFENKKVLSSAPGVGQKTAAQIILDLKDKIHKVKMYSNSKIVLDIDTKGQMDFCTPEKLETDDTFVKLPSESQSLLTDAIMACKELGFKEDQVIPLAQKILDENLISKSEQLIHLVLKEI